MVQHSSAPTIATRSLLSFIHSRPIVRQKNGHLTKPPLELALSPPPLGHLFPSICGRSAQPTRFFLAHGNRKVCPSLLTTPESLPNLSRPYRSIIREIHPVVSQSSVHSVPHLFQPNFEFSASLKHSESPASDGNCACRSQLPPWKVARCASLPFIRGKPMAPRDWQCKKVRQLYPFETRPITMTCWKCKAIHHLFISLRLELQTKSLPCLGRSAPFNPTS